MFSVCLWCWNCSDFSVPRKKFWLIPLVILTLLFGALVVLTQSSAVAPFIYTIF